LSRETVTVDALGHTEGEVVIENNVDPDCENAGSYDNVVYCTVCGEELSRETIKVDALGHSYTSEVTTQPTCTEKGVMTYTCLCGDSYTEDIPATGHHYEDGNCTCGHRYGDVNNDNQVNAVDVAYLNAYRNGKIALDEAIWRTYDKDGSGKIETDEIQELLVYVLGLPNTTSSGV
jgi:hypothetical protein